MEQFYPLVWIAFIICLFLAWFFSHKAKHKERMMKIEKGLDVDKPLREGEISRFPWLKLGVVIIGLSVGLLIIGVLAKLDLLHKAGGALPLSILGICGGVSFIIANYLNNGKSKQ